MCNFKVITIDYQTEMALHWKALNRKMTRFVFSFESLILAALPKRDCKKMVKPERLSHNSINPSKGA